MKKHEIGYLNLVIERRNRYLQSLRLRVLAVGSCAGLVAVFVGWILHADEGKLAQTAVAVPLLVYSIWLYGEIFFSRTPGSSNVEDAGAFQGQHSTQIESIDWSFESDTAQRSIEFFRTTIRLGTELNRDAEHFGARPARNSEQNRQASSGQ